MRSCGFSLQLTAQHSIEKRVACLAVPYLFAGFSFVAANGVCKVSFRNTVCVKIAICTLRGLRCTVKAWPGIGDLGGKGGRPNASDHPSGRAVDYGIPQWRNPQGRAYGWDVARWVATNADSQNVTYIIWDARIWKARTGKWETYTHPNGPTTNPTLLHLDHVHVSYRATP